MTAPLLLPGANRRVLIVCDHASNAVPAGIELGVDTGDLDEHIAWDIGSADLSRALADRLNCPALLASVSRLVVDCNRAPDDCIPEQSDGRTIAGNLHLSDRARARRLDMHSHYHQQLETMIRQQPPALLVAVHSFTPQLRSAAVDRPWPIALLWNRDERATIPALAALRADPDVAGPVGANEPYSGRQLNYTMDRHAEDNDIPYLAVEVRQDELQTTGGIARHAAILHRAIGAALATI